MILGANIFCTWIITVSAMYLWVYPDFLLIFRWKYYTTDVLSCQQDKLVAATNAHRRDLTDKIYNLQPNGTSELEWVE